MPRTVRVGDTVTYHIADGDMVTADVTVVTDQDDIDLTYHHQDESALLTTQANAVRTAVWPPAAGEWFKMA